MNDKFIGVFDSGVGGLTALEDLKKNFPNENFLYLGDTKRCPYGTKTKEELESIVESDIRYLEKCDVKMIVIACNTATTRCIEYLRNKYPNMIFVGTEPAVKVACDNQYKNTLVMATPLTINSPRLASLVNENISTPTLEDIMYHYIKGEK